MMKWADIEDQWAKQINNPKKRLRLFLISLVVIYFIWAFLFLNPVRKSKNELISQMPVLQSQLKETQQKINIIHDALKTKLIANAIVEKQQLEMKVQKVQQALAKVSLLLISQEEWIKLKKEIISQKDDMDSSITLQSIADLPVQPWVPAMDRPEETATVDTVYQHALEIKFQADYFSTIRYLSRLEKLPWRVYWDSLDYKVLIYPKAEVTIKFHIFTQQPSEA